MGGPRRPPLSPTRRAGPGSHFVSDRTKISLVHWSGDNVLLLTIRQPFNPKRQTPWESQGTSGESEFVLRKLWILQDSVVFYCGFISPPLSTTSVFFFFLVLFGLIVFMQKVQVMFLKQS